MRWRRALIGLVLVACGAPAPAPKTSHHEHAEHAEHEPSADALELVESWPAETTLDHPDIRDASDVWPEMFGRAKKTIDLAEFYASEAEGAFARTSKLTRAIDALAAAVKRGVRVRMLVDASFATKYPETLARLEGAGVVVRRFDVGKEMGGVLHAKYFVVDDEEAFVGSQNFDWRALGHIQEMGVRLRGPEVGLPRAVFAMDWATATGEAPPPEPGALVYGANIGDAEVTTAASPEKHLPPGAPWDLPMLLERIGGAKKSILVQLLTYGTKNRDGSTFTALDDALRAAAARGVKVSLFVSHWAVKPGGATRASLEALAAVPNVTVRVTTIPPSSSGDIPFARVAHAKYAVFDDARAWVGTSNWEGDYFLRSRNLSVFVDGGNVPRTLARVFAGGWSSAYAAPLPTSAPATSAPPPSGSDSARR